jgi:hypothetical protein
MALVLAYKLSEKRKIVFVHFTFGNGHNQLG